MIKAHQDTIHIGHNVLTSGKLWYPVSAWSQRCWISQNLLYFVTESRSKHFLFGEYLYLCKEEWNSVKHNNMATCFDPTKGSSSGEIIKQVIVHKMYTCLKESHSVHKVKKRCVRCIKNSYDAVKKLALPQHKLYLLFVDPAHITRNMHLCFGSYNHW
jgi:hypothetical protein